MIQYDISFDSKRHLAKIILRLACPIKEGQLFKLPQWTPGSYMIRNYARHFVEIFAQDATNHNRVLLQKLDNNTWECGAAEALEIHYQVYGFDQSVRGCFIDSDRVFINGSAVFLEAVGFEGPLEVRFNPEPHQKPFKIVTQLQLESGQQHGWGSYRAKDYQHLLDCPITMGDLTILEFEVQAIPHCIALSGNVLGDLNRLKKDVQKICQAQCDVFADTLPFDSYLFMLHLLEEGYGGLEHMDSTALIAATANMPLNESDNSKLYQQLLGLFSHEYFHVWNVKRIKPAEFVPYDLNTTSHTKLLWVFEGFTSYYDELGIVRSGAMSEADFFQQLANTVARLLRTPGRFKQSLADSSFDAWTKFYIPNENSPNQEVSYYLKGAIVACLIDLQIRAKSNNEISLDDVMRVLWQEFGKKNIGLTEDKIREILSNHGLASTFIDTAVYGIEELPIEAVMSDFGLQLEYKPLLQIDAYYPEAPLPIEGQGFWGWQITKDNDKIIVNFVAEGSPAQQGGLSAKDEVVAINASKVSIKNYDMLTKRCKVGETVQVTLFRENKLKTLAVTLGEPPKDVANIVRAPHISEKQKVWIDQWLGRKTN